MGGFQDAEIAEYRAVSGAAVASLIFGSLSIVALVDPFVWIVPAIGIVCGLGGLWQISQNPTVLIGRKAAIVGLGLSVLFGTTAVGNWTMQRWMMRSQARDFASLWFTLYQRRAPEKAFQLLQPRSGRRPLNSSLWNFYKQTPKAERELEEHVEEKLIRTLLALGEDAEIRYRGTDSQGPSGSGYGVDQTFSVTYYEDGEKKTFFVGVRLFRSSGKSTTSGGWRVSRYKGGVKPNWLSDETEVP